MSNHQSNGLGPRVIFCSSNYNQMNIAVIRELASKLNNIDLSEPDSERKNFNTLSRFKRQTIHPLKDDILKHFVYSFIVVCHSEWSIDFLQTCGDGTLFECQRNADVILFTNSLDRWRYIITESSVSGASDHVLSVMNQILTELEKQGLSLLFKHKTKQPYNEGFILV